MRFGQNPVGEVHSRRAKDAAGCTVRICPISFLGVRGAVSHPRSLPHNDTLRHATADADLATAADPFSPHAFLPLIAALDRAVERFVGLHLIRCEYPRPLPLLYLAWLNLSALRPQALPVDIWAVA